MALITGAGGNASLMSGFNADFETWDATFDFGEVDTTAFADVGWTNAAATICKFTFNAAGTGEFNATSTSPISGTALAATFAPASCAGTVTLTAATGCTYACTALITQVRMNRSSKQGTKFDVAYSGTNQGAVTQTWDQTA
jgi:hypothetical protein